MATEITDSNFDELVLNADRVAMVDFSADWCGPCRMIGPVVDQIAEEYSDRAVVGKVDVDANPGVSAKYNIRSIPAILFFKNGEIVDRVMGAVPKKDLTDKLDAQL